MSGINLSEYNTYDSDWPEWDDVILKEDEIISILNIQDLLEHYGYQLESLIDFFSYSYK